MKSLQVLTVDTTDNSCFEHQRDQTTKLTMPINDASMYSEKIKSASAPLSGAVKSNAQLELLLSNTNSSSSGGGSSAKPYDSTLIKHQGQKWQQIFDFEKMLKQIRVTEKQQLRGKGDISSSNGKNATSPNRNASLRCPCQQKQVKRLNGSDMQYYGIVPKQTALDVVVCNVCVGVYTKVGFNNHMMLQHPSVWSTVPNKVTTGPTGDPLNVHANDNSQDVSAAEIVGSPSDVSGTMSTCSNASSTSSLSSTYVTNPSRHKSSKNGSTAGSSSGSSSGGRSRSKTKHHSSSPSIVLPSSVSSAGAEMSQTSSKSSKSKNSNTNLASAAVATASTALNKSSKDPNTNSGAGTSESLQPIPIYSSSSNSSCSLPPTPKIINAVKTSEASRDHTFSPASLISLNDSKDKHTVDAISVVASLKKKVKSPPFAVLESVDSSTSNSSSEYERTSSSGGTTASSSKSSNAASKASSNNTISAPKKAQKSGKDLHRFNRSELDQAVSSITCGHDNKIDISNEVPPSCMEGVVESSLASKTSSTIDFKLQSSADVRIDKMQMMAPSVTAAPLLPAPLFPPQQVVAQACGDEPMPHNYSDDNSISTLDEMLDSKFINELLNTAESEIHFDENELDTTSQQTYLQQQPATKRMRFDDGSTTMVQQQPTELSAEFAVFQQQQLLQQQQQQYPHYNESNLEDIKIYNTDQQTSQTLDSQYQTQQQEQQQQQQQITAIDAMQLQQLLYQQQTLATYGSGGIQATPSTMQDQQQQQFDPTGKQIIDLCAEDDLQKPKHHVDGKLTEYSTLASINNNNYEDTAGCDPVAAHFQIFNIPSLTDDTTEDNAMLVDNGATTTAQQYVLPSSEEHLIYEITANNQVSVMSQQRQQQVIAEFLTQAGYENVENVNNSNTAASNSCWDDELLDFDYSLIDTVKSLSGSGGGGSESKSIKSEQYSSSAAAKYHDDFYFNVFIYSGIPRPLAINSFGLLKLPHAAATTFRKHLLTTRKANNSPITLSGGINGVVGSNVVAAGTRFANVNSKPAQNYFTALSGGNGSLANEFSIGSITITNSPNMSQHQQAGTYGGAQQKQQNSGGPIEITFNAANATNGTATSPGSAMHRARPKSNTTLSAFGSANCGGGITKNKALAGVTTPVAVVTPLSRTSNNARTNTLLPQNAKTIYVSSTANGSDRVKFVKRSLIAPKVDANKKSHFSSKQIAEMLSGGKNFLKQQQQDQDLDAATADEHFKLNRVNRFYERRQKLLNLAHNSRQCPQQQQQQQLKPKLLKPHLLRTLSDCGINSKANNPNGSSDIMRVFV